MQPRQPPLLHHSSLQIYAAPLAGGARAVVLANFQTTQSVYPVSNITVFWTQIGLQPGQRAVVRDLFAEQDLGTFTDSFSASIAVHDVAAVRVTPLDGLMDDSWRPWHGQPIYAPQPANLAVMQKADWAKGGAAAKAWANAAAGQRHSLPGPSTAVSAVAVFLAVVVAVAAVAVLGYYVAQQLRRRGWQQLDNTEEGEGRLTGEVALAPAGRGSSPTRRK